MSLPQLFSLSEAARLMSPNGRLTARSLHAEVRNGRLAAVKIANKLFVTQAALNDMVRAAALPPRPRCPAPKNRRASTSGPDPEPFLLDHR